MCNNAVISFTREHLASDDVRGKDVLEVGSLDVNGSVRPHIESLKPRQYVGVDLTKGPRVDLVCDVANLTTQFGEETFDVLISTELVEHVRDWRDAFANMKGVLRPGGTILVTTRSYGMGVHGYPYDYWRYELDDMRSIFEDFDIIALEPDQSLPGVCLKATKPTAWSPSDLSHIALYSVITKSRVSDVTPSQEVRFKLRYRAHRGYRRVLPESIRAVVRRAVRRS